MSVGADKTYIWVRQQVTLGIAQLGQHRREKASGEGEGRRSGGGEG